MKKLISLSLILALTLIAALPTAASEITPAAETDPAQLVAQLGGTAGEINILLGDRCIAFTDAVPEARNGRTMVPLRAALEAMGATVDYDAATGTARVTGERASFTHRIGSDTILLADGTAVKMDTASYVTPASRTMVPVRFFSQVLGYDVFWDGDLRMVFLLDAQDWVDRVDGNFTVLNAYLARSAKRFDAEKNYRETLALTGTLTAADADGDLRTEKLTASLSSLYGRDGMNLTLRADLGALGTLLAEAFGGEHGTTYGEALTSFALDALYTDRLYVRSPLLDAFAVGIGAGDGAWYAASETDYAALSASVFASADRFTVGNLAYALVTQSDPNRFYASYRTLRALETTLPALLGDETFTKAGSSRTRTLGASELAQLVTALTGEACTAETLAAAGLTDFSLTLRIYTDGRASLALALTHALSADAAFELSCTLTGSTEKTTLKGSARLANPSAKNATVFTADYSGTVTVRETDEALTLAPPAGEKLLTLTTR